MKNPSEARSKVYDILKSFSSTLFITLGESGQLSARPMHVAHVDDAQGEIWFLTGRAGTAVSEVKNRAGVLLAFQNENSAYLSVRGQARVVENREKIAQLWKEPYKVWFPGGIDDPEIVLLVVNATDAEYWDNRGLNKLEYLFEAAKAYVKGERPDLSGMDQHATAKL